MAANTSSQDIINTKLIALMGPTGAGKSTFGNVASGSQALAVSGGLRSCTSQIQATGHFLVDDERVMLIDTPGFDDTDRTQSEILELISDYLVQTYARGIKLNGIIYFHKISDNRMGGIARQNFRLVRTLCGDEALKNVIIATTMWEEVSEEDGRRREAELAGTDVFFKPAIDGGARMVRHQNTQSSAQDIIRRLLPLRPQILQHQREVVDEHKNLSETEAGRSLLADMKLLTDKLTKELEKLRGELEAVKNQNQLDVDDLKATMNTIQGKLDQNEEAAQRLKDRKNFIHFDVEIDFKDWWDKLLTKLPKFSRKA